MNQTIICRTCGTLYPTISVNVELKIANNQTKIIVRFESESKNSIQMQKERWQAILVNFRTYTENN